jgi:hypothetical protein
MPVFVYVGASLVRVFVVLFVNNTSTMTSQAFHSRTRNRHSTRLWFERRRFRHNYTEHRHIEDCHDQEQNPTDYKNTINHKTTPTCRKCAALDAQFVVFVLGIPVNTTVKEWWLHEFNPKSKILLDDDKGLMLGYRTCKLIAN